MHQSGLALLGLVGLVASAPAGEEPVTAELTFREASRWELLLPEEGWTAVGDRIVLNGLEFVVEQDGAKLLVDTDGDGHADERVTGASGFVRIRVREDGAAPFRYALRLRRHGARWEWATGCTLEGRVAGVPVRLVDLDGDGTFDDFGRDALVTGKGVVASYLSRVVALDGALYHFALEAGGAAVRVAPYDGPVASLDAKSGFASRGALVAAVFLGGDVSFDAARSRRDAVLVPAGEYRFVSGVAERGSESVRLGAGRTDTLRLEAGDELVLDWGGPLTAEFTYEVCGDRLTVRPDVRYFGRLGEEYRDFMPFSAAPRLSVYERSTGKLVGVGSLGGCCGGGYSAYKGSVPRGIEIDVTLEQRRSLFGLIEGRGRERASAGRYER